MKGTPRIRAFLPGRLLSASARPPAPQRVGEAPKVFREFSQTLGKLERAAVPRRPAGGKEGR